MAISFSKTPRKAYYLYTKNVIYKITTTPPTQDMLSVDGQTTSSRGVWSCYFRTTPYYKHTDGKLSPMYTRTTKKLADGTDQPVYTQVTLATPYLKQKLFYSYTTSAEGSQTTQYAEIQNPSKYYDATGTDEYEMPNDHKLLPSQVVDNTYYYFDTLISEGDSIITGTDTNFEAMDKIDGVTKITSYAERISKKVLSEISLANYATTVANVPEYVKAYAFSSQSLEPFGPIYMKKLIESLAAQAQTQISKTQTSLTNYDNKGNCTIQLPLTYSNTTQSLQLNFTNIKIAQKTIASSGSSSEESQGQSED